MNTFFASMLIGLSNLTSKCRSAYHTRCTVFLCIEYVQEKWYSRTARRQPDPKRLVVLVDVPDRKDGEHQYGQ